MLVGWQQQQWQAVFVGFTVFLRRSSSSCFERSVRRPPPTLSSHRPPRCISHSQVVCSLTDGMEKKRKRRKGERKLRKSKKKGKGFSRPRPAAAAAARRRRRRKKLWLAKGQGQRRSLKAPEKPAAAEEVLATTFSLPFRRFSFLSSPCQWENEKKNGEGRLLVRSRNASKQYLFYFVQQNIGKIVPSF
jgi:hypothetical protein